MQTVSVDQYIEMVKSMGIEGAYRQRFRGTGRTVRDILQIATLVSSGEKIVIIADGRPGNTLEHAREVMHRVKYVLNDLGMQYRVTSMSVHNMHNDGELRVVSNTANSRGLRHKEYKLHDC